MSPGGENIRYTLYGDVTGAEIIRNHRSELFPEASRTAFSSQNHYDQYDLRSDPLSIFSPIETAWEHRADAATGLTIFGIGTCILASAGACAAVGGVVVYSNTAIGGSLVIEGVATGDTENTLSDTFTLLGAGSGKAASIGAGRLVLGGHGTQETARALEAMPWPWFGMVS
ncbi:MAG TPA: hypothetical protein ENI86_03225 [Acidimicrobiales bacterium]|nr:hypothetical protein [Acidimicrobiales bacterium]